jgi:hypothetical protein
MGAFNLSLRSKPQKRKNERGGDSNAQQGTGTINAVFQPTI